MFGRHTPSVINLRYFALIGWCSCLSSFASGQDAMTAEKPTFRAGDTFHYCNYDLKTDEKRNCYSMEFVETRRLGSPSSEHVFISRGSNNIATEFRITDQLSTTFRGGDGALFDPHNFVYQFPLRVGEKWRGQYDIRFADKPQWNQNRTKTAEVVAYEEITVPAGKFKAFKIRYENWNNVRGTTKPADETIYYCPDIGYFCLYESDALGSVRTRLVEVRRGTTK